MTIPSPRCLTMTLGAICLLAAACADGEPPGETVPPTPETAQVPVTETTTAKALPSPAATPSAVPTMGPSPASNIPLPPTPTPVRPAPVPSETPTPLAGSHRTPVSSSAKGPLDYTDAEIKEALDAMNRAAMEAAFNTTDASLMRLLSSYSETCRPSLSVLTYNRDMVREVFSGYPRTGLTTEMKRVTRFPGVDDAVLVTFTMKVGGRTHTPLPKLLLFDNGRWLSHNCAQARDALEVSRAAETPLSASPATPTPAPAPIEYTVPPDPSTHTDEQIARSLEAVAQPAWEAMLLDSPNMTTIKTMYVEDCRIGDDRAFRALIGEMSIYAWSPDPEFVTRLTAVERLDATRAWASGTVTVDGMVARELTPMLLEFEDGHWRVADCTVESTPGLVRPAEGELNPIRRVSYIGELVRIQEDWDEPLYGLVVLGPLEMMDGVARLPVRIVAVTDMLNVSEIYTPFASIAADPDESGSELRWWSVDECDDSIASQSTLVLEGTHEGYICFEEDPSLQPGQPSDELPFVTFEAYYGDEEVIVDLTRSVDIPTRRRFAPDDLWGGLPHQVLNEPAKAVSCYDSEELEVVALGLPETVEGTDNAVRVRLKITASGPYEVGIDFLPFELTTAPEQHGRIHLWERVWDDEDPALFPGGFSGVLQPGESREGYVYFRRGEDTPESQHHALLAWRDCQQFPIHLRE